MGKIIKRKGKDLVGSGIENLDLISRPGEVIVYVFYDVTEDKVRNRIVNVCKDYGLERIQFSGFIGYLSRNKREELALKLKTVLGETNGKILLQPVCEKDFREYREFIYFEKDEIENDNS